jgi:hypothetical protein
MYHKHKVTVELFGHSQYFIILFLPLIIFSIMSNSLWYNSPQQAKAQNVSGQLPSSSAPAANVTTTSSTSTNQTNFLPYENRSLGVRVLYPSAWDVQEFGSGGGVAFHTPLLDNEKLFRETFSVIPYNIPATNMSLNQYFLSRINEFRQSFTNSTINQGPTPGTLNGNPAEQLLVTIPYADGTYKLNEIWTVVGGKAYQVEISLKEGLYAQIPPPHILMMLKSLELSSGVNDTTTTAIRTTSNNFLTYENSTYGIKIRYPSNWSRQEFTNLLNSSVINIVDINPPIAMDPNVITYIDVGIKTNFGNKLPLDQLTRIVIEGFRGGNYTDFKLISATTNSTLGGTPAYSIVYTFIDTDGLNKKHMERGAFIGGKLYYVHFSTETSKYEGFLPVVQDIMNSFSFMPQNQSSTSSQLSSQGPVTGTEAVTTPPVSGNNISQLTQAPSLSTSTINETQSTR